MLNQQDEQREREKLYGADKRHAVVRPPECPAQMKEHNGYGSEERYTVCAAEQSFMDKKKEQSDQYETDQR